MELGGEPIGVPVIRSRSTAFAAWASQSGILSLAATAIILCWALARRSRPSLRVMGYTCCGTLSIALLWQLRNDAPIVPYRTIGATEMIEFFDVHNAVGRGVAETVRTTNEKAPLVAARAAVQEAWAMRMNLLTGEAVTESPRPGDYLVIEGADGGPVYGYFDAVGKFFTVRDR